MGNQWLIVPKNKAGDFLGGNVALGGVLLGSHDDARSVKGTPNLTKPNPL